MKEDWEKAIEFVLRMEGGYTLDANDPGGETNFGISKKAYPSLDIKNLTIEEAQQIYQRDYWLPCACDELPPPFAIAIFDMAVNMGVVKAKRLLQMALDVDVDGIVGERTVTAAKKASHRRVTKLLALRCAEYARLMVENNKLLAFSVNWSFRVLSLSELINGTVPT